MASRFQQSVFDLKTAVMQRPVRSADRAMRDAEILSADELHTLQRDRAMRLARLAFDGTTFYRRHYRAAGIERGDLDADIFDQLPIVEKAHIREDADSFQVAGAPKKAILTSTTGGSTGQPLQVKHDRRAPVAAMWWRTYRWWGISPADDSAYIYRQSRQGLRELAHRIEWWPTRQILLNARGMTAESMAAFVHNYTRLRPALINGYVDGVLEFAQFLRDTGTEFPAPKAVAVTAAPLLEPKRMFMEDVLGAPVYDCYRSAEVPWIAAHCAERNGLHVLGDIRIVECVDEQSKPAPDGSPGEVVVSDLTNEVFPLIRYRLGDRSAVRTGTCSCGMTLPRIDSVQGRVSDVLRTPSGRSISGGLSAVFNGRPTAVRQFQIVQDADYSVRLVCVPSSQERWVADAIDVAVLDIRQAVGDEVPVRADLVDQIVHDGGKLRVVRSALS